MALSQAGVAVWVLSPRWNQELLLGAAHPPSESSESDLNREAASECDEEEEESSSSHPTPRLLFLWEQGCSRVTPAQFRGGCLFSKHRTVAGSTQL